MAVIYRALLDRYAILAQDDPDLLRAMRVRAKEIEAWFYEHTGWRPVITGECAYLPKLPFRTERWQGYDVVRDRPLHSSLDYELVAWVLWYGERKPFDHTFLIGMLATEILEETRPYVGTNHLDWNRREHRESLVRAMRTLEVMGAVRKLDGEAEWFERDGVEADLVYEFTPFARFVCVQPAAALMPDGVTIPSVAFERPLTVTQRLYRTLLLTPALYAHDDPEAFALLKDTNMRVRIASEIERRFGWHLELTSTYAALLRLRENGAQPTFPTGHIITRIALLFCQHVRDLVKRGVLAPDTYEQIVLPGARFESELGKVKGRYDKWWGAAMRHLTVPSLAADVAACLIEWGVASGPGEDGAIVLRPTTARFGAAYQDSDTGLTDEEDFA